PVAIIVPRLDAVAVWPEAVEPEPLRAYVADRLRDRPANVPEGVTAEVPIASGDEQVGAVLMLAEGNADAGEFLHLAAVASLTEVFENRVYALLPATGGDDAPERTLAARAPSRTGCAAGAASACRPSTPTRPASAARSTRPSWCWRPAWAPRRTSAPAPTGCC